jgi:hypothetical protein
MNAEALETIIATDKRGLVSALALLSTIGIYANCVTVSSFFGGVLFFSIYSVINSVFLGRIFFQDENTNFRVALGLLLLLTFLAATNGLAMFVVALEIFPVLFTTDLVVAILFITATVISLIRHIQTRKLRC